jgi:hypothetical protein
VARWPRAGAGGPSGLVGESNGRAVPGVGVDAAWAVARKAAWRAAPARMADRAHRHQRGLWAASGIAVPGDVVVRGPFAGMRYPADRVSSVAKRLGAYESELHPWLAEALAARPARFVDVGAADGFYAVGFARAGIPVEAFELAPTARRETEALAELNGVALTLHGKATSATLARTALDRALLLCDCEGAEVDILTPDVVARLRTATVIVEVHDWLRPGTEHTLLERFAATHAPERLVPTARDPSAYPELEGLSTDERVRAVDEGRGGLTPWLRLRPRS